MRTVLRKIINSSTCEKEERVVVCDICGDIWPLYEHKPVNWVDYHGKIQCVKHCPEALENTSKTENIIKQLLNYKNETVVKKFKGICPECGSDFLKNHKEQITCGISCSNKFFKKGSHDYCSKKVLSDDEVKDVEKFEKDLGDET